MVKSYYERYWDDESNVIEAPSCMKAGKKMIDKIFSLMDFEPKKILDAGCGIGIQTNFMNKRAKTIGIDLVEEPLIKARKKYPGILFKAMNICHTYFPNSEFDLVTSFSVIEHVLDTEAMFKEFNRILKKGGYLALTCPQQTFFKNLFITLFYYDRFFYPTNPHIRFYTKKTLKEILEKNGFEIVYYEPVIKTFGITTSMFVLAKKIS
jgi:ubiquinone/menaquinone biosynthesis C-methylase UbiE